MRWLRNFLFIGGGLILSSCAAHNFKPDQAPEYVIIRNLTPFYRHSPRQGSEPDASLKAKTRVKLLRKEKGYSFVLLKDSRTGYIANEDIAAAPPGSSEDGRSQTKPRRKKRPGPAPVYQSEQLNEVPPFGLTAPSPDLQVAPSKAPEPSPTPEPSLEKPKFRL